LAPTGVYAGYSFAIPVSIVKKIVEDIVKFGDVQRGFLGITYVATDNMSEAQLKAQGIPANLDGVYVSDVSPDGGAFEAGIRKGDVITKVNNVDVRTGLQMSAAIASFRPGDRVPISYLRNGKAVNANVVLKKRGDVITLNIGNTLGAELATLDKDKARQYGVRGGVVVNSIREGGPIGRTRMQQGFVITSVNGQDIRA
jgi:serine protease Do